VIEQRLKETFDKVTAYAPDEADAFERFLRRRARRTRRVARATTLAFVLLLGSVVAVPSLVLGSSCGRCPRSCGAGWSGRRSWTRATWRRSTSQPAESGTRAAVSCPIPPCSGLRRARSWRAGGLREATHGSGPTAAAEACPPTGTCPGPTTAPAGGAARRSSPLRTLHLSYQVEQAEAASAAADLAERVLGSARPTGNAVAGRAHAPRPECLDGRSVETDRLVHGMGPERGGRPSAFGFFWEFRTTGQLIPCTVRGPVGIELLDGSGRRLEVQGNGCGISPVGSLPGAQTSTGRVGTIALTVVWRNWCGDGQVRVRWIAAPAAGPHFLPGPSCIDPSQPSVLSVERTPP
jgi:hypothetical protein